jgi:hypothetical protein
MAEPGKTRKNGETEVEAQAQQQTGTQQVRLRIDDHDMTTIYSNAFRTNTTAEEIILDFGMNVVVPAQRAPGAEAAGAEPAGDILFRLNNRVVMNYYTAKRLALLLGQLVRRHEEQFGELKLNAAERMVKKPS